MKRILTLFALAFLLTSCGGGGSSVSSAGGVDYTGNTSQATISASNGSILTSGALGNASSTQVFASQSEKGAEEAKFSNHMFVSGLMAGLKKDLENPVMDAYKSESATAAMETYTDSATGNCGGSAAYSISADTTTGIFSGTITLSDLCENQVKVNGTVSFSGKINITTEKLEYFDFNLNRVNFTQNGDSATIGGTLHITGSSPIVVTANFVVEENSKTYKLQDTTIKIWDGVSYGQFELSGRFYDHDYGYVDVVTNTRFKVSNSSYWPYDGKLTITGNNSSATITANNSTTYTVVVTESGTVTSTTTHNWSEL
jgi:hypothetical protein